jgi:hypothetical protein
MSRREGFFISLWLPNKILHITSIYKGQYYHLEFLYPPGDVVRIATLGFTGTCFKLTVIA